MSPKRGREMKRSEGSDSACILIIGKFRGFKFMYRDNGVFDSVKGD